jgi:hypothetical protein
MSAKWLFHSFNPGRFYQVFGKAKEQEELALLKIIEFEMGCSPEDPISDLARRIVHHGINYSGMQRRDAEELDQVLSIALGPEGLWTELEMEAESVEGFSPKLAEKMVKRVEGHMELQVLPALLRGRRYGTNELVECRYCILDTSEVARLAQEVRAVLETPGTWSAPEIESQIVDGLLYPCEYVSRKQKGLAGVLA